MPADDRDANAPHDRFAGFSSYADDSLRPFGAEAEAKSWGPPPRAPRDVEPLQPAATGAPRRSGVWIPVAGGVVVAGLAAIIALQLRHSDPTPDPADEATTTPRVQVVQNTAPPPAPVTAPSSSPPANSLPGGAVAPAAFAPFQTTPSPRLGQTGLSAATREPPAQGIATQTAPKMVLAEPAPAARRPAGPCDGAGSYAQSLVCTDPALGAADRRMARAYSAALRAGVSEDELRADQEEWLRTRDDAARYSRHALLSVYQERIGELEDLARDGGE
jgi:uncharacterized protein YecT (DUF1311 family)